MKAILVPYACGQNEPSKPLSKLYDVPTDTIQRDLELMELFFEHVCSVEDPDDFPLTIRENEDAYGYGDLEVSDEDGDLFLFVTYVTE